MGCARLRWLPKPLVAGRMQGHVRHLCGEVTYNAGSSSAAISFATGASAALAIAEAKPATRDS